MGLLAAACTKEGLSWTKGHIKSTCPPWIVPVQTNTHEWIHDLACGSAIRQGS